MPCWPDVPPKVGIVLALAIIGLWNPPDLCSASLLTNGVAGQPRVDCGAESITVWIRTERNFHGRLYVEEESEHEECVHNYAPGGLRVGHSGSDALDQIRLLEFGIRFGQCNMRRQRILNPRGVAYSFTLVVSFHPVFLTGIDKAFNIKCFFLEAVKAIDIALDVSPLTTVVVEREFALPQCTYHLKQSHDGAHLKFANIGEPITHVWQCDPVAGWIYGVLIHSCYVDDGRGNRFDLIDEKGCAIDRYLLEDLVYDERGLGAFVNTHVFRYADRIQLFFTCTLQLCFKDDGGCRGITPPSCSTVPIRSTKSSPLPFDEVSHKRDGPAIPSPPPHLLIPQRGLLYGSKPLRNGGDRRAAPTVTPMTPLKNFSLPSSDEDSRLSSATNNTVENETLKLLLDEPATSNATVRTGRDATTIAGRIETDLSADLTVLPLHESKKAPDSKRFQVNSEPKENSNETNLTSEESTVAANQLKTSRSDGFLPGQNPRNDRLLAGQGPADCLRWNRSVVMLGALALALSAAGTATIVTALVCAKARRASDDASFASYSRAAMRRL